MIFTQKHAKKLLPRRNRSDNKFTVGKSLIVAGSKGMFGAAVLTATACERVGAGYVTLLTDSKKFPSHRHPDFLIADQKQFSEMKFNAAAIGPGMGVNERTKQSVKRLLKLNAPVVIDADALNACAKYKISPLPSHWVATPHEGELAKLLNVSSKAISQSRKRFVQTAQKKLNCIVVLKGHQTLIASQDQVLEIPTGNPALAKAGTGDVLTGMICGFLTQGLRPLNAAALGAFVHGFIADEWIKKNDIISLMASDILNLIPSILLKIRNQ